MATIGIIGANGQVGTEVCLFLSQVQNVNVIPICRTELGSAFLRKCGLECRHGSVESSEQAGHLLEDCDLVADFSLVKGRASQIRNTVTKMVRNALTYSAPGAKYVYISTIMAFGMSDHDQVFHKRFLSSTVYGSTKRYGERLSYRLGRRMGREVYMLRLGQVHGELQEVSRSIMSSLKSGTAYIPPGPSWTVFVFSIAEALVNILNGKERPGFYTVVSVPSWSWRDIHEYYCRQKGVKADIVSENTLRRTKWYMIFPSAAQRKLISSLLKLLIRYREIIAGYLLFAMPRIEGRIISLYSLFTAKTQITKIKSQGYYRPYDHLFKGKVPGRRLGSLSDSRITMDAPLTKVRSTIRSVCFFEYNN